MGKLAGQRVTFRASARLGAIAASLAAAAALILPSTALASTPIGSTLGIQQFCGAISADTIQLTSSGPSYVVPTGGTHITDWSLQAAGGTGSVNLLVWRLNPATGGYTLIEVSPQVNLSDPNSLFTLTAPGLPVLAGDHIGLRMSGPISCFNFATPGTFDLAFSTTAVGSDIAVVQHGTGLLNVAATVDVTVTPPPTVPTSADQCKHGGWRGLTDTTGTPFKNQGDCVSFVATAGKNAASAPPADATNAANGPPADATTAPPPADATIAPPADTTIAPPADTTTAPPADTTTAPPADATTAPPADTTTAPPADATSGPPADATNAANAPPA